MRKQLSFGFVIILSLLLFGLWNTEVFGQSDSALSLDLLRAPVSPAGNMLGITNNQIARPSDPADFMTIIQTATNNYSVFPTNLAVDFTPAWVFWGHKIDLHDYLSANAWKSMKQSMVLSVATNTVEDLVKADAKPTTYISTGINVSLLRGKVDQASLDKLNELQDMLAVTADSLNRVATERTENHAEYRELHQELLEVLGRTDISEGEKEVLSALILTKMDAIASTIFEETKTYFKSQLEDVRTNVNKMNIHRVGGKLDLAGAVVWAFPQQNYKKGDLSRASVWLSGGYEFKKVVSLLALARYQYYQNVYNYSDEVGFWLSNTSSMDLGARLILNHRKFSLSGEAVYRYEISENTNQTDWTYTLNMSYDVGKNKQLSFSFGKGQDIMQAFEGDLFVALNLLLGFGTERGN